MSEASLAAMQQMLRGSVNADGGWGYYPGTASRVEPTCWAVLALLPGAEPAERQRFLDSEFFRSGHRGDGFVMDAAESAEERPNVAFNALVAIALKQAGSAPGRVDALRKALVEHKGIRLPQTEINRQDNQLQGWAWIDGEFSWVEPTCWSAIALKKIGGRSSADASGRLQEAERLLADRCCEPGGWNYGNANVLGQQLRPYVSTTAIGLIALQDRRSEPFVDRSLRFLVEHRLSEQSGMALALASLALRLLGTPADDVDACLIEQWGRTRFLGNCHLTAMAYYSLTAGQHGAEAFRV